MTRLSMRLTSLVLAAGLMAGCGVIHHGKKVTPTVGDRISVLTSETDIQVDEATAALPMELPTATDNADWGQPGGNAAKSLQHVALGTSLGVA